MRLKKIASQLAASPRDGLTVLYFAILGVYVLTASYSAQSVDTASMYFPAWQIVHHGNVSMDAFASQPLWWVQGRHGLVSNRFPGATLLAVPFYLLDRSVQPSDAPANLAAAATTAGASIILLVLLRSITSRRRALAAALIFAFATPTWTVSADALWTHGPGQFWLLLGLLLFVYGRPLAAGLALGAGILTRPHYAVLPAVLGIMDLASSKRIRPFILLAVGSSAGLALLIFYNGQVFGSYGITGAYGYAAHNTTHGSVSNLLERVGGTLVSPSRGALVLTPFLLLLLPGIRAAWRGAPLWVRASAIAGTGYMLVQLRGNGWSGGYAFFSYRLAIEWLTLCAPLLTLSYAAWTAQRAWRRRAFDVLVLYSFVTHALGAVLFVAEKTAPDYWRTWHVGVILRGQPFSSTAVLLASSLVGALSIHWLRTGALPEPQGPQSPPSHAARLPAEDPETASATPAVSPA